MSYLIDTNCFLRLAEPESPHRSLVLNVIKKLRFDNEIIHYTPQILAEFWNACTRPDSARGGLGLSVSQTERKVRLIETHFRLLPDSLATFIQWRNLVADLEIMGVQVHDAKIVASMVSYKIPNLITFNVRDFTRFNMINVIDPRTF